MTEIGRRFSLDKDTIDPSLLNRIFAADGDEVVGSWDGENIHDLIRELDRIEERVDANYNSLPHNINIPEDLKGLIEKDCSIWTCDRKGNCLVGERGADVESVDQIREHYKSKYGSMEAFKEKKRIEHEKFVADVKSRASHK